MTMIRVCSSPSPVAFVAPLAACLLAASGCASAAPPPPAVQGGPIDTLQLGTYTCEMPGDAAGAVGKPVAEYEFSIVNSSSYKAAGMRGSYLYVGEHVTMTGGRLKGLKLHRLSNTFLRQVKDDGSDGDMRCVLTSHR